MRHFTGSVDVSRQNLTAQSAQKNCAEKIAHCAVVNSKKTPKRWGSTEALQPGEHRTRVLQKTSGIQKNCAIYPETKPTPCQDMLGFHSEK
ncbi:Uncharacterised protein [Salmonella enterica subsp. salamae]|nr:Uncharacterised protein [Salmonella enterica subsp. salamae]